MRICDINGNYMVDVVPGEIRQRWCDQCLSGAGIEVDLYVLCSDGPRRFGVFNGCRRCDEPARE